MSIDEKAFAKAVKIAGLSYLLDIPGNREIVIKLFETYEAAKTEQPVSLNELTYAVPPLSDSPMPSEIVKAVLDAAGVKYVD